MSLTERRRETRLPLQVPLQYRPLSEPSMPAQKTTTVNISQRGVFFLTDYPFQINSAAELTFGFPRELSGRLTVEVCCTARVVRVERPQNGGPIGVGVYIERMEMLPKQARKTA